ncbi:hypothetical protein N0V88_002713 [Collariella sp. IMI 366227]|nr:hypothetical protein N0V88_002713 [Collariella sp. IMI 366227]
MAHVAPATKDAWSYSGDFHVEASGNNRHRRATVPEIKSVFDGTDGAKDRPGHWYEAQLIHYGLPPSKTKGTAKMRLLDALNKGNLAVPSDIRKVESELKKEWAKRDREAKQALKKLSAAVTPVKGSNKRKAGDAQVAVGSGTNVNINLSLSIGPQGNIQVGSAEPVAKKARTTKAAPKEKTAKAASSAKKSTAAPKEKTAKAAPSAKKSTAASKSTPTPTASTPITSATKQTVRRGTSSARATKSVPSRSTAPPPMDQPAPSGRVRQTARRSRPFNPVGYGRSPVATAPPPRFDSTPSHWALPYDEPPPPYPGSPAHVDNDDSTLPPLGLLNGRYRIHLISPPDDADLHRDWHMILTLEGDSLWGSFDIGRHIGIIYMRDRPFHSSHDYLGVKWRGEDKETGLHPKERPNPTALQFLGGGRIAGSIAGGFGSYKTLIKFEGQRVEWQSTRSEISAAEMKREWERWRA